MESYKTRMIEEYRQLKERQKKLHEILVKADAKTLDFKLTCPMELLRAQNGVMAKYLYILEVRAEIEGIDLQENREEAGG